MSDTSVQTSLRQAWFTSVVAIVSIAVLGLILEIAVGSKPVNLFNKLTRAQEGAAQIRMELRLLGKLLADDPKSYPADLSQQLAGMRESMTAGLQLLGKSGLKSDNEKAFEQLEVCFQERFLPDFINFRQPYGDQDRPKIRARLKVSRDDLESRVGVFERSGDGGLGGDCSGSTGARVALVSSSIPSEGHRSVHSAGCPGEWCRRQDD